MTFGELEQIERHYESGQLSEARDICLDVVQRACVRPDELRRLALIALRSADPVTAIRVMERALAIQPGEAEYHNILGNAYRDLGELQQAMRCFERATELAPHCADAHNNFGACLLELGDTAAAVTKFEHALALEPYLPAALYNLGNARQLEGRFDEAISCYQQVLWYDPEHADAHTNLGAALHQQRRLAEAAEHYHRSLQLHPNCAEAENNLGALFHERKEIASAIDCYRRALAIAPEYHDAQVNLADALNEEGLFAEAAEAYRAALQINPESHDVLIKLGGALQQLGQLAAAEECYRQLAELLPGSSEVLNNLGVVLQLQGKTREAVACYGHALQISGVELNAYTNLAAALRELGEFDRAQSSYECALRLQPKSAPAYLGLADLFIDTRRLVDARRHYDLAASIDPGNAEIQLHRALGLLRMADFQQGWSDLEWRWRINRYGPREFSIPRWSGQPLNRETILIHAEQGLGDTIQFVRYLSDVKRLGCKVILACSDVLLPLLTQAADADQFVPLNQPFPPSDYHAPLMSLPSILGTTLETIPGQVPYLFPKESLVRDWSRHLERSERMKVGICWHGNPEHPRDRFRSIPLELFFDLCDADTTLISLQKEKASESIPSSIQSQFVDLSQQLDIQTGAFMDTAAVMKNLDLVITCDSAIAHLAGALAVEVWVALDFSADWRWLLDRDDSPWYPTMRLFRQTSPGDWAGVFQRIRQALDEFRR